MSFSLSITESNICAALITFLQSALGLPLTQFVRGQSNRVTLPAIGTNWLEITPLVRTRLATNEDGWSNQGTPTTLTVKTQMRVDLQCDCYGPTAGDNAQIIASLFRDSYACASFQATGFDISPLYTSEPRNMEFTNDQRQYEYRWSVDVSLQANPVINTPAQFADTVTGGLSDIP